MKLLTRTRAVVVLLLVMTPIASATVINDVWAPTTSDPREVNLYGIYNSLYGTAYSDSNAIPQVSPDEVFALLASAASVEATARYAALGQQFGYYQPTSGGPITYTQLFDVQDPNSGYPLSGFTTTISPTGNFGFYDLAGGVYWHSQAALNPNGEDHLVTLATADPNVFLLAWEDLPLALADGDFNDLVVEVTLQVIPEPTTMALLGMGLACVVVRQIRARKLM
ncbi:MAG: DUF4114 domain-containing protein [Candidatus Hydrogenedentes bacterium]|nr:DUF4114 domain-containing protein [Candidatus Hydrogenedentota bacterium]